MPAYHTFYHGPFSQWFLRDFFYRGQRMHCAEQAMMWEKALLFGDTARAQQILLVPKGPTAAKTCKALGRAVEGFVPQVWNHVARTIVFCINFEKFSQHPDLMALLLATQDAVLVEASPTDTIWGVGLAGNDPRIHNPAAWRGTNWLGQVLTKLRDGFERVSAP